MAIQPNKTQRIVKDVDGAAGAEWKCWRKRSLNRFFFQRQREDNSVWKSIVQFVAIRTKSSGFDSC